MDAVTGGTIPKPEYKDAGRAKQKKNGKKLAIKILVYILLIALGTLFFIPFLWMIMTSLKDNMEIVKQNFWPKKFIFSNYPKALTTMPFLTYTRNTLIITGLNSRNRIFCIAGCLLICKTEMEGQGHLVHRHAGDNDASESGDTDSTVCSL